MIALKDKCKKQIRNKFTVQISFKIKNRLMDKI